MRSPSSSPALWSVLALGSLAACSSSSGAQVIPPEAGGACAALSDVLQNQGIACPVDASQNPAPYEEAITTTCASLKLTTGDIEYGQCFDYLVFRVDLDASGQSFTKCFYDVVSRSLVGVLYSDGPGKEQCGGSVDRSCGISGLNTGGGGYQSCAPIVDAGSGGGGG